METKFFHSKYNAVHKKEWAEIIKALGGSVYDVYVPCELAVILGGYFENPAAFKDALTVAFYKRDAENDGSMTYKKDFETWKLFDDARYDSWLSVLKHYYDEMVDLTGLTPTGAAKKIKETVEAYQS